MSKYILKTFCGEKQIERFDNRSVNSIKSIISHPRHHRAGEVDGWGNSLKTVDRFELFDTMMVKLFDGNIDKLEAFVRKLR